jgi:signal transduction histidine kinase
MYARVTRQTDASALTCRYVDQVEPAITRLSRFTRWFREINPTVIDVLLGSVLTVAGLLGLFAPFDAKLGFRDPNALAVVLALGCSLPFFVRRRAPFAVHCTLIVFLVVLSVMKFPANVQSQMVLITSYTVGAYCGGVKRRLGVAALVVGVATVAIIGIPDATTANLMLSFAIYMAAYFFGTTIRNRRLYEAQLEARAELLEREAEEEAKRAVADERLRIAQDLHDVVAHSMGVIAVQAGVGAHVIDTDPAEAKKALEAISHTSRSTLGEIRRMLGALREDEGASYAPAPGLADLERLVREICAAGVDTHVTWEGARDELPPGVDFTAYRIVQESLTNVLKHAGPEPHVDVTIRYEPQVLRIEVVDDGRGVNGRAADGGHGLMGMRERVAVYGGEFDAGPAVGGGFRVAVRLPYGAVE